METCMMGTKANKASCTVVYRYDKTGLYNSKTLYVKDTV